MTTGVEFYRRILTEVDNVYSTYMPDAAAQRLLNECVTRSVEKKYRQLDTQRLYDELTSMIVTEEEVTLYSGFAFTAPIQIDTISTTGATATVVTKFPHRLLTGNIVSISEVEGGTITGINLSNVAITRISDTSFSYAAPGSTIVSYTDDSGKVTGANTVSDYVHYLTAKVRVIDEDTELSITGVSLAATTATLTFASHNFRNGDTAYVANVSGTTIGDDYYTVTVISRTKIRINVTATGTYTSGGTASIAYENYATRYYSDRKAALFGQPSYSQPMFEEADGSLKFYPAEANQIVIDYIRTPKHEIDITDDVVDIEIYYPAKFLDFVQTEYVLAYSADTREDRRFQSAAAEQQMNP